MFYFVTGTVQAGVGAEEMSRVGEGPNEIVGEDHGDAAEVEYVVHALRGRRVADRHRAERCTREPYKPVNGKTKTTMIL